MTAPELRAETDTLPACSLLERVTGIEPALSAWKSVPSGPVIWPDLRGGVSASDRERPLFTGVNGPLMARRPWSAYGRLPGFNYARPADFTSTRDDACHGPLLSNGTTRRCRHGAGIE
jgi:hypothetical protein